MTESQLESPFDQTSVEEVPLEFAPLIRVIAQVKWPETTKLQEGFEHVAKQVGLALAETYPLPTTKKDLNLVITPDGISQQQAGTLRQLSSPDDNWHVTFSHAFVALDTVKYTSKSDFCSRFEEVLRAIQEHASIPIASRVGFRYINRLDKTEHFEQLSKLVRPEVRGGAAVPVGGTAELEHILTEAVYRLPKAQLLARWGQLPPNATIDPSVQASVNPSWVLDLDAYRESRTEFDATALADETRNLAATAYGVFRWAITDEFIKVFGGSQ